MKQVVFGSTGLKISRLTFGTWQLSPRFWGDVPKEDVVSALRLAHEQGINCVDTADAYGDGYAETVVGAFLRTVPRDEVVLITKVFNHFNPDASRYPDLSPAHIRQRCEIELSRLGTDHIDVYLLHFHDPLTAPEAVTGMLETLRKEGKIRHYGVSNFTVEQLRAYRTFGDYAVHQPPYSLLNRGIESDLLPYCQSERVGVMVYSPLHMGLLTGKYRGTESFMDFRQHHKDFMGERFRMVSEAVQGLKSMADRYHLSIYQLVLAATLAHPGIHTAVVGIKTPDQIREAAGAGDIVLERSDVCAIRQALTIDSGNRVADAGGGRK